MRLLLEPFFSQNAASRQSDDKLSHAWMSTSPSYSTVQNWFRFPNCLLTLQAPLNFDECCEPNRLLEQRTGSCWEEDSENLEILLHCLQPPPKIWNVTCHLQTCIPWAYWSCVGIRWAMVLIGNAKQAISEEKSRPVTGVVASQVRVLFPLLRMYPQLQV